MREDLIAYVLGELNEADCQRIEQELACDPDLQDEVERIRCCVQGEARDDSRSSLPLPRGLADRTTESIVSSSECDDPRESATREPSDEFAATSGSFTLVDMTVAMAVLLAIGSMMMPALHGTREDSKRVQCQNNLRELGNLFTLYSQQHGGFLPLVAPNEHAGVFSIRMAESGVASRDELSRLLVCSASPRAEYLRSSEARPEIPTAQELSEATGPTLLRIRRTSGGDYACQLGYVKNGLYYPAQNRGHFQIPILSDAPNVAAGRDVGANHNGTFINTLFQDGSVRTLNTCLVARDHIYFNSSGEPVAGTSWRDAMMAPSYAEPGVGKLAIPDPIRARFFEF